MLLISNPVNCVKPVNAMEYDRVLVIVRLAHLSISLQYGEFALRYSVLGSVTLIST